MTTETNDNRWVIVWLLFAALAVGLSSAPLLAQPADSGPGQALRVNGAGAHVAVPFDRAFAMGSGFFTIELWFRLDSLPTDAPAQFVSNDEYELGVDKPDLGLFTGGHGAGLRGFRQVRAGRWYHVAWIKGEAGMQLIVNGVLESPTGQTSTPSGRAETDLWIGSDPSQSTWAMHGLIDELRIWRRARSVDEIIADKNRSAPVNPDSLILHYSFDAIDPDGRIPDVSGNGHTGKLAEGAELTPSDAPIDLLDLSPVLAVSSTEIHLGPAPTVTFVSIDNAGGGVVSWSLSESAPWLRAASFFGDSEDGGLEGVGDEVLALYTSGRDLPAEEHEARVTILSDGGEQEIAVKLSPSPGYPTAHALASSAGQLLPLSFNSGMQVPALTPLAGLTRFTIEFWVKRFPGRGDGVVLVVADAVTQRLRLSHDGESWRWRVNRSARQKPPIAQAVVSAPLLPDTYHHVAIVQDGDTFRFYADGSLAHEQGNMRVRWHNADYRLVVGNGDAGGFFLGNLDELRIWDQALSRDQIARRINLSLRGDEEHLVAYWRFDELDASGRIPDLSGNGQHGIMPPRRTLAASTAPVAVEAIPALRVVPIRISANGDRVSRSNLAVANVGGGVLFWELQSDQPWLRLSRSARHLPLTRLSGEGAATVLVHTDGRGLPSGEYIGTVTGAGNGGSVVVSVVMRVRTEPELDATAGRQYQCAACVRGRRISLCRHAGSEHALRVADAGNQRRRSLPGAARGSAGVGGSDELADALPGAAGSDGQPPPGFRPGIPAQRIGGPLCEDGDDGGRLRMASRSGG